PIPANIPAEHLSRSPEVVRSFESDPLVHDRITPRLFDQISAAMGLAVRQIDRIRVPLLFLIAGSDRIVDAQRSTALADTLRRRAPELTVRTYPASYHELLNEPDRALVMADIRSWIETRRGSDAVGTELPHD
ncbi:MAG: serine aminopeptidase domain-containing protein, partial [Longimicrobiales bacterium]